MYIYIYIYTYVYVYMYIYIYTCIYIFIHVYISQLLLSALHGDSKPVATLPLTPNLEVHVLANMLRKSCEKTNTRAGNAGGSGRGLRGATAAEAPPGRLFLVW